MKKVIVFLLILKITFSSAIFLRQRLTRSSGTDSSDVETTIEPFNFSQKLDHFHLDNDQEWNQRYWISKTYYKTGGPAFLLINGDKAGVNAFDSFNQPWVSYAKKLQAFCFTLEHRFYGRSVPRNKDLNYLNIAQALADIAYFIKVATNKFQLPKDTKWILFGCSYAGKLVAWARLKYPHLIHGAVASGAALVSKVNRYDYLQNVENSFKSYNPKCLESITRGFEEMAHFFQHTKNDETDFHGSMKVLLLHLSNVIFNAAQYNDANTINIATVCNVMINHNGTKLAAFVKLVNMNFGEQLFNFDKYYTNKNLTAEDSTIGNSTDGNSSVENSTVTDSAIEYSAIYYFEPFTDLWSYQRCSELGGFINYNKSSTFSAVSHLLQIEHFVQKNCEYFFGFDYSVKELNEKIIHTNVLYGGLDFNAGNTLFIHGSIDPLHTSGIYKTTNGSLYETIFINGTSHCTDFNEASDKDAPELKEAREETLKIIGKWLKT